MVFPNVFSHSDAVGIKFNSILIVSPQPEQNVVLSTTILETSEGPVIVIVVNNGHPLSPQKFFPIVIVPVIDWSVKLVN